MFKGGARGTFHFCKGPQLHHRLLQRTAVDSTDFCSRLRLSVQQRTRCFDAFTRNGKLSAATMPLELNPEKTCLLFFDMLNGHVKKEDPDTKMRYSTVVPNAVALLNKARELSI